jgi:DNA-binding MarR family transcriptional regulator
MIKAEDGIVKKVSKVLRRILGGSTADQIEAGYRNDDLSLTEKGKEAVLAHIAEDKEVDGVLASLAKEELDEAKEEKKKNCK